MVKDDMTSDQSVDFCWLKTRKSKKLHSFLFALIFILLFPFTSIARSESIDELWQQAQELMEKIAADTAGNDLESRQQLQNLYKALSEFSRDELLAKAEFKLTVEPGDFPVFRGKDSSISFEKVQSLRTLLVEEKYDELNSELEQYQRDFESDYMAESALEDAYRAVLAAPVNPETWIAATPNAYTAYLVAAAKFSTIGWQVRGSGFSHKVDKNKLEEFKLWMEESLKNVNRALTLKPESVVAHHIKADALKALGKHEEKRDWMAFSLEQFPGAFWLRWEYIHGMQPRWGGSLRQIAEFATEQNNQNPGNPMMPILLGFYWSEKGDQARFKKDFQAAKQHYVKALEYGDHNVIRRSLATTLEIMGELDAALTEIEHSVNFRPMSSASQQQYARTLLKLGRVEDSRAPYEKAKLLSPIEYGTPWSDWASNKLVNIAQAAGNAGKEQRSIDLYKQAISIDPQNSMRQIDYGLGLMQFGPHRYKEAEQVFLSVVKYNPSNINGYIQLTTLKRHFNTLEEMIPLWGNFIQIAPDYSLPIALRERAIAYETNGQFDLADADRMEICRITGRVDCE